LSAKNPNSAIDLSFVRRAEQAAARADGARSFASNAAAGAARTAVDVAVARAARKDGDAAHASAAAAVSMSIAAAVEAGDVSHFLEAVRHDVQQLSTGRVPFDKLVETPLWSSQPPRLDGDWQYLARELRAAGEHWSVWIKWYDDVLVGQRSTEFEDAAFTDSPGDLPWDQGSEAVNTEIARRLAAVRPDPAPIEGISSPITINRKPDGRIGVEAGPFSLPDVPAHLTPDDHRSALTACRSRAAQRMKLASSPQFQGRSEYAQILGDYLE